MRKKTALHMTSAIHFVGRLGRSVTHNYVWQLELVTNEKNLECPSKTKLRSSVAMFRTVHLVPVLVLGTDSRLGK